jgi:predicted ATP-binding protein involved in virulence
MTEQQEIVEQLPPVYFASIEVENVLCFKKIQKLDLCDANGFPAQWTVIIGENGVGKTTLLRCLAAMEPCYISIPNVYDGNQVVVSRLIEKYSEISWPGKLSLQETKANITTNFIYGSSLLNHQDYLQNKGQKRPIAKVAMLKIMGGISASVHQGLQLLGFQCHGYGVGRQLGTTSEKSLPDHTAGLFINHQALINVEKWLVQADSSDARTASIEHDLPQYFDLIKEILQCLLPDITNLQVAPINNKKNLPTVEFLTPYGWVDLANLGFGYQTMIAWIVDLSVRMITQYPHSKTPLAEPAVVLIDEIDLHLHPQLQRQIMSVLTAKFPNTQFIVTTQSPLIVQSVQHANLVLLRRDGEQVVIDNNPQVIENWGVAQVLTSVFALSSPYPINIEPLMQRRRELLSKSSLTKKDQQELTKLEEKIGHLPTAESPEDIQAMDIIHQAAKILKNSQAAG